jgi:hypothetical protein
MQIIFKRLAALLFICIIVITISNGIVFARGGGGGGGSGGGGGGGVVTVVAVHIALVLHTNTVVVLQPLKTKQKKIVFSFKK